MSKASLELGGGNWAAKDGNLLGYAVGDTSGKYLPREFDFTRDGDICATRVNEDGLIEKYRENLLLESNNFSTTWSTSIASVASVTSGESGYDGSGDVWLLSKTGANGYIYQNISQSGVLTYSVYAKAGTTDWIGVLINGSANAYVYFDLGNGVAGTPSQLIDNSIESVGNGWYRCSITFTQGTISRVRFYPAEGDDDAGASSGSIYIQDAQLEQGLVATDYLESGATTGKAGVLENLPRIDYTGGSASLLLEPQRKNEVPNSEYHSGSTYGSNKVTTTDNEAVSPEGVQNAAKIVLDNGTNTSNGGHYLQFSSTAGTTYTISVFAKAGEMRYFTFTYGSTNAGGGHFDLQEGTLLGTITNANYSDVTAGIEDYGNGWYRLVVSLTDSSVSTRFLSMKPSPIASVPNNNNYSSTGDGTSGAYIYGFQLEEGSYPTSYIPTYGVSVTRNADFSDDNDIVGSPISFGANDDFTLFYEGSFDNLSSTSNMIMGGGNKSLGDAYKNYWWVQNATTIKITGDSEVLMASASMSLTDDTNHKLLVKRDGSTIDFFVDGSKLTTTQLAPNTAFVFRSLGWSYTNSVYKVSGNIKQAIIFPTALSNNDAEIITGTSYNSFADMATSTALNYTIYE